MPRVGEASYTYHLPPTTQPSLHAFHLEEVQLHRRLPAKEGHQHLDLALLQVDIVDGAVEVLERPIHDAHVLTHLEPDLDLRRLDAHLAQDPLHLGRLEWHGPCTRSDESRDARRIPYDKPGAA